MSETLGVGVNHNDLALCLKLLVILASYAFQIN